MDISDILQVILMGLVFTMPVFFINLARSTNQNKRLQRYDKAISQGKKVVRTTAVMKRSYTATDLSNDKETTYYVYHYKYRGRTYKYKVRSDSHQPSSITLSFFENYPKGATNGAIPDTKGGMNIPSIIITFIVMTLSCCLVYSV